jgi:tripartite-type tricarboxylate transporter receptor subunit TctC
MIRVQQAFIEGPSMKSNSPPANRFFAPNAAGPRRDHLRQLTRLGLAGLLGGHAPAWAQEAFPSRSLRVIVPFAPGGIADIMSRVLGKAASEGLAQPVVIDNKPGAGTIIGTELGVRARPDGYTLLSVSAPIATNPGLHARLPYEALRDLAPVIQFSGQGFVIAVHERQPWRSLAELVQASRSSSVDLPYGSPGSGTLMHLVGQRMNADYGTRLVHVPYRGSGPALQDAASGQIPMIIDPATTSLTFIRQGKLRPLAVTHPTRLPMLPEVPTVREAGFPALEAEAFSGLMVPTGTPPEVIARLNLEFNRAMKNPEVIESLVNKMGSTLVGGTPEAFGAHLRRETERWVPLIRRLGIQAD